MAQALGIRTVDHADEALQQGLEQCFAQSLMGACAQVEQEALHAAVVSQPLAGGRAGRGHALDRHRRVPVAGRGDRARIGAEADQGGPGTEALAAELADVQLPAHLAHVGEAGVAAVTVMRSHDRPRVRPVGVQELAQGVEHVPVAHVPALG